MIETFLFEVNESPQVLVKKDFNCNVSIKGSNSIVVGSKELTLENGFPLAPGYNNFKLMAGDLLYVMSSSPPKIIQVMIAQES